MTRKQSLLLTLILTAIVIISGACLGQELQPVFNRATPEIAEDSSLDDGESLPVVEETGTPNLRSQHQLVLLPGYEDILGQLEEIPYYQIEASVDPEQSILTGEMIVWYANLEDTTLDELYFRLFPNGGKSYGDGSLQVTNLKIDQREVDGVLSISESVLRVDLPDPLGPGESLTVSCDFVGEIPQNFGGSGYGLFNQSESVISLSGWFPLLAVYDDEGWNLDPVSSIGDSVYSDAAFFDVHFTVPVDYEIAATGESIEPIEKSNGLKKIHFLSGPARDFYLVMSPDFKKVEEKVGEVWINAYYLPGHKKGAQLAAEVAADSVRIFNQRFGMYPYQELDVVDAPMRFAAGIEFPGVILIGSEYYDQYQDIFFSIVVAHEVAHQWWYNVVGSDVIDEPWLDEALVTYSSNLYFQTEKGEETYQGLINYYRGVVEQTEDQGSKALITDSLTKFESTERGRSAYSPIVYSKGALFYAALRERIGDEAFFTALQRYYQQNIFGIGIPEELLGSFEFTFGEDLDAFYEVWLYQ